MGIGKRIKQRRIELGYSQSELADLLCVTPSAIANYENNISHPKEQILYELFKQLQCDANFLFQDEMKEIEAHEVSLTEHQKKVIDAYIAQPEMQSAVDKLLGVDN